MMILRAMIAAACCFGVVLYGGCGSSSKAAQRALPPCAKSYHTSHGEESTPASLEYVPYDGEPDCLPFPTFGFGDIGRQLSYTNVAQRAGVEGRVLIRTTISEAGNVIEASVQYGIGFGLDERALAAVKNASFSPGMIDGKPAEVTIYIPVTFSLPDRDADSGAP